MDIIKNFPLFVIILAFVSVVICSLLKRKGARYVTISIDIIAIVLEICVIVYTLKNGSINYQLGHFPAPFNNEIRIGVLQSILATLFPLVILLSILGGIADVDKDLSLRKGKYLYVLLNLTLVSLTALTYTNDIFTGYVFLEIATLSSIGLIVVRDKGHTIAAGVRYMIFNLLGSGLFLIGCVLLYDITGYLSMEYIKSSITILVQEGKSLPMISCTFALISIGLGIKSGMFPFHFWMPDTYGESTTTSACVVSGVVSKGYIVLLISFIYRTFGWENINATKMINILFVLGVSGIIFGSIAAIRQTKLNPMVAFSSAAQIGYIYMGIGLGEIGILAAVFQIFCHAITKPLLFVSSRSLIDTAGGQDFITLRGSAKKNALAGIGFVVGSFSMVGIPLFAGFFVKYLLIKSCIGTGISIIKLVFTLIAIIVSTFLNTIYYLRTTMNIYRPPEYGGSYAKEEEVAPTLPLLISIVGFVALNLFMGTCYPLIELIIKGLGMLA